MHYSSWIAFFITNPTTKAADFLEKRILNNPLPGKSFDQCMDDYAKSLIVGERIKHVTEYVSPNIALPKTDNSLSCMLRYVAGHVDQVTYDRAVASALYRVFKPRVPFSECFLTNHAKDVEGQNGQLQNKFVCVELAGRQAFQIHVRLQLAVILFAFSVCMVVGHNVLVLPVQIGPESIYLDVGNKQELTILIRGSLNDFIDNADCLHLGSSIFTGISDIAPVATNVHGFTVARSRYVLTVFLCKLYPAVLAFPAKIMLDVEKAPVLQKNVHVFGCIIAGIQSEKQFFIRHLFAKCNGFAQVLRRTALTVPGAFPKLQVD